MKLKFRNMFVLGGTVCLPLLVSHAQDLQLDAGAAAQTQGAPLSFAKAASFAAASGYTQPLSPSDSGIYAGYHNAAITLTALPATAANGGPSPQAAAPGSFLQFSIVKATGPIGGSFGFWEQGANSPTLSLLPGDTSERLFPVSESDGAPGSDPFGDIQGRRITATKPGVYTAWFKLFDTSANGLDGGSIHSPSEPLAIRFVAGTPILLNSVAMGGGMIHVNIQYLAADGGQLHVHVDAGAPLLTPLAISQPGAQFDPAMPWFEQLDPSLAGRPFNRQYGFLPDPTSDPLPAGHAIWIRQLSASPGLTVHTYRQNPATWQPMFGTAGSSDLLQWSLMMFHPAYSVPANAKGPFTASYEALVVDELGQPTGVAEPFALTWNAAPGLDLESPTFASGSVSVPITTPATWDGYTYRLERTSDLKTWTVVDELSGAAPGTHTLQDANPPTDHAVYRVRPHLP